MNGAACVNERLAWRAYAKRAAGIFVVAIFLVLALHNDMQAQDTKGVLVLYWYNRQSAFNVLIEQGFLAALDSAKQPVEYYSEYLESERFPGDRQVEVLHEFLRQKYADERIDVVVASGDAAHEMLVRHRHTLFPHAQMVFIANPRVPGEPVPGGTGIATYRNYRKNVDLILRLHPGTRNIFIVSGTLDGDRRFAPQARADLANDSSGVQFSYLTDLPLKELLARVRTLPPRSAVLVAWQQSLDEGSGTIHETSQIVTEVARAANAPVYLMSASRLGTGAIGGEVFTMDSLGSRAAHLTLRILAGTPADSIPVESPPSVPMFDWRELRRWKIPESRLPPGSILQFRELTAWDQYHWYILGAISFFAAQASLIIALLVQRSRRRRAELKAHGQQRELLHLSRVATVGELTGTLAHELRQPLTAISANAFAARRLLATDSSGSRELRDALDDIIANDRRAGDIITRVREVLRKDEGVIEDIDVNLEIREAISLLASEFLQRSTLVTTDLAANIPYVRGSRVELQQVLLNLMLNASDAMNDVAADGRRITVRSCLTPSGEVQVCVADQGAGIPPNSVEKIFGAFYTTKPKGLGLGLAICRRIITEHGGRVWAVNNEGKGARVVFVLPTRVGVLS